MFKNLFHNLANKKGYYQLSQLKVGGMCGCCGERIPYLIWVDTGSNIFDDISVCHKCKDEGDDIIMQAQYGDGSTYILTKKMQEEFNAEMGKMMFGNKEI